MAPLLQRVPGSGEEGDREHAEFSLLSLGKRERTSDFHGPAPRKCHVFALRSEQVRPETCH